MKKSLPLLPISQKAYTSFIERIFLIFTVECQRTAMLIALDRYLMGDKSYAEELAPECAMAFEMLRFDIDLAIARSASARLRARQRKQAKKETTVSDVVSAFSPVTDDILSDDETPKPFVAPLSRRQRRAMARKEKPKNKFRSL